MTELSVRDCGAVGDGTTKDTAAIQAAIDQVAAAGGGRVVVPAGRYRIGTIHLRDHIELHLAHGSVLCGSPDRDDYNPDDHLYADQPLPAESVSAAHLVIGIGLNDVAITGTGTIDGNADAFMEPTRQGPEIEAHRIGRPKRQLSDWRPAQMIFLFQCSNVSLRDLRLENTTYWTLYLFDCEVVSLSGLRITNPADTPNGDGIDIVSSRRVTISDCIIRSGDDCLVFRTRNTKLHHDPVCEDIAVTNCILSTPTAGIRIAVSQGMTRRVTVSNTVISHARTGLLVVAKYGTTAPAASCEQIHLAGVTMDVAIPLSVVVGYPPDTPTVVRDISLRGCDIVASAAAQVVGTEAIPVDRLTISDTTWRVVGGSDNREWWDQAPELISGSGFGGYPGRDGAPTLPAALWTRHTRDLVLSRVRLRWEDPGRAFRDGLHLAKAERVTVRDCDLAAPGWEGESIRWEDSAGSAGSGRQHDLADRGATFQQGMGS